MTRSTPDSGKARIAVMDWVNWDAPRGVPALSELRTMLYKLRALEHGSEIRFNPFSDRADPVTDLPAPIAGGHAWRALARINEALLDTQGWFAVQAGYTGIFYATSAGIGGAPSGLQELPPLRVLDVDTVDVPS